MAVLDLAAIPGDWRKFEDPSIWYCRIVNCGGADDNLNTVTELA
jgi:hypothetical protein